MDPRLENHTDDEYRYHEKRSSILSIVEVDKDFVTLEWMMWDNVDEWKNKKLKEYVKEKQREWLHIPDRKEIKDMLQELGDYIGLQEHENQITMLMYLTGMNEYYWLSMNDWSSRDRMRCWNVLHYICYRKQDDKYSVGSLCMMACENS